MIEQSSREIELREVASGLQFPEGPIAMPDGSVVLVEIARGTLSRVDVGTGAIEVVADCGGGPNGAAVGPDGAIYVCNNGAYFQWHTTDGVTIPGPNDAHVGGSIQRVDPTSGSVETLYTECDGQPLVAPNDLVFDDAGGFWFTDHGVQHGNFAERPGLLYAKADGSRVQGWAWGTQATNGVGLSPSGDRVYAAETHTGTVWEWPVGSPGALADREPSAASGGERNGGSLLFDAPAGNLFDSLAVDGEGWICVATIAQGGITSVAPDGSAAEHIPLPDFLVTNICFGGPAHGSDDFRTAYVTASSSGRLFQLTWPRAGLQLPY